VLDLNLRVSPNSADIAASSHDQQNRRSLGDERFGDRASDRACSAGEDSFVELRDLLDSFRPCESASSAFPRPTHWAYSSSPARPHFNSSCHAPA
jgi:hypothetical protein